MMRAQENVYRSNSLVQLLVHISGVTTGEEQSRKRPDDGAERKELLFVEVRIALET